MPVARVSVALVVGLIGAASLGPRLHHSEYRVREPLIAPPDDCTTISATAWSRLPGLAYTGRLSVHVPAGDGALVLIVGDTVRLDISAESANRTPVPLNIERFRAGPAMPAPPAYWLEDGSPWEAPPAVVRATLNGVRDREQLVSVRLGRRAPRVLARIRGYAADVRGMVCAVPIAIGEFFVRTSHAEMNVFHDDLFGTGWYGEGRSPLHTLPVRWMSDHGAVLIPSAARGDVRVRLEALSAHDVADEEPAMLTVTVNDVFTTAPMPLPAGASTHDWTIPRRAWLAGTNELFFAVSRTIPSEQGTRMLGMALRRLSFTIISAPGHEISAPGQDSGETSR